jgi:hypothetical protein
VVTKRSPIAGLVAARAQLDAFTERRVLKDADGAHERGALLALAWA